jgi:hypothetical protein
MMRMRTSKDPSILTALIKLTGAAVLMLKASMALAVLIILLAVVLTVVLTVVLIIDQVLRPLCPPEWT